MDKLLQVAHYWVTCSVPVIAGNMVDEELLAKRIFNAVLCFNGAYRYIYRLFQVWLNVYRTFQNRKFSLGKKL